MMTFVGHSLDANSQGKSQVLLDVRYDRLVHLVMLDIVLFLSGNIWSSFTFLSLGIHDVAPAFFE